MKYFYFGLCNKTIGNEKAQKKPKVFHERFLFNTNIFKIKNPEC
jgi:hypothetical protein